MSVSEEVSLRVSVTGLYNQWEMAQVCITTNLEEFFNNHIGKNNLFPQWVNKNITSYIKLGLFLGEKTLGEQCSQPLNGRHMEVSIQQ